jgi:YhcH/YjgK/YiaL family protein
VIIDSIQQLSRYDIPFQHDIARFLKTADLSALSVPEHIIDGRSLFVRPMTYQTRDPAQGKFETHRLYMDLQYVVKGSEIMETAPADALEPLTEYDPEGDYHFFTAKKDISRAVVRAGEFAVFFPGEAHRPCCSPADGVTDVSKLVFKILFKRS